jgi:mannose-6-phosphate isomerase
MAALSDLYPLTFEPAFRSYIWGGRNLEAWGRRLPPGPVAESWEISGHPASPTRVKAGPLAGRPLTELVEELGPALLGWRNAEALRRRRFPLLVKLLDAAQTLSVQVHPDDAYAAAHEGGEWGKTEMWYILDAGPMARIIYGLRAGVTPDAFRAALAAGQLETCLHYLPVQAGDVIFIPAGAIHALLGDAIVLEIQQTSDITYRVYDWNRVGADGKPRPLHIEPALAVMDFGLIEPAACRPAPPPSDAGATRQRLCRRDAPFMVERVTLPGGTRWDGRCDGSTFEIWVTLAGAGQIAWAGGSLSLPALQMALLPAALGEFTLSAEAPAVFLRAAMV